MKPVTPLDHKNVGDYENMVHSKSLADSTKRINNAATVTQLPISPGQKLKQAREKKGLQLADIAHKLHLSERWVKAIELDDFESLPGDTFTRGYIRLYAREVQLSAGDLVAAFEEMIAVEDEVQEADSVGSFRSKANWGDAYISWVSCIVVAVVLALAIIWWWNTEAVDGEMLGADQVSIVGSDGKLITETLDGEEIDSVAVNSVPQSKAVVESVIAAESVPVIQAKPKIRTSLVLNLDNGSEKIVSTASATAGDNSYVDKKQGDISLSDVTSTTVDGGGIAEDSIFMSFTGDCWVRIGDANDKTIHVSLRRSGQVLTVKGAAPFHVKLGDAKVVALRFNDKTVQLPEPRGESNVVNFILSPEPDPG